MSLKVVRELGNKNLARGAEQAKALKASKGALLARPRRDTAHQQMSSSRPKASSMVVVGVAFRT